MIFQILTLLFLILSIPLTLYVSQKTQELRGKAVQREVVLTADLTKAHALPRIWQNLAQGGEVPIPQLPPVVVQLSELSPRYIRIDHIYDAYHVVRRDEHGKIFYDFSILDKEVDAILRAGATPFFSLSYIPADLAAPDNPDRPSSYALWEALVGETIAHYSGKQKSNIVNVFYEVYNEPDLFGKWRIDEYMLLYEASVNGARVAENTNTFFIGGPALSYFDTSFIDSFLRRSQDLGFRIDFVSWHTYSPSPLKIAQDARALSFLLSDKPAFAHVLKIVSEWGSYPQKHIWHDSIIDSAHLVATVSRTLPLVDMLFYFEIKDGDGEAAQPIGGWGILKSQALGFEKKPRFYALSLLNQLKPLAFTLFGIDERIYGIASGDNKGNLAVLLSNYSFGRGNPALAVRLGFLGLLPGNYTVRRLVLGDFGLAQEQEETFRAQSAADTSYSFELLSDNVALLSILRTSPAVELTVGKSGDSADRAAKISASSPPVLYDIPIGAGTRETTVSFAFREEQTPRNFGTVYFESKGNTPEIPLVRLGIEEEGFSQMFSLSVTDANGAVSRVSLPASQIEPGKWYTARLLFDNTRSLLELSLNDFVVQAGLQSSMQLGDRISFGASVEEREQSTRFQGAIDDIQLRVDGEVILSETF